MTGGLDSLMNGVDAASFVSPGSGVPPITAYEKHGLRVVFTFPASGSPGQIENWKVGLHQSGGTNLIIAWQSRSYGFKWSAK